MSRSEREKMLANEPYLAADPELVRGRERARHLCALYNATTAHDPQRRASLLRDLFGSVGTDLWVEPPFFCDYGSQIELGERVYINCACIILDCNTVTIGDLVKIGPAVQIYTAYHPLDPDERRSGLELAAPIRIGANAWIGGGVIICPGVEIGADAVIGAGSVVTRSIPPRVVAAGNPCRVVRELA
jgi:maltose O-acetyltransferase